MTSCPIGAEEALRQFTPRSAYIHTKYMNNLEQRSNTTKHWSAVLSVPPPSPLPAIQNGSRGAPSAHLQRQEDLVVHHSRQLRPDVSENRHAPERSQRGPQRVARPRSEADVPGRREGGGGHRSHGSSVARRQGLAGQHAAQAANNLQRQRYN